MTETPPLDFQSLRLRGLDWLQRYAGERWTDYNVHDPGVTLLEALVYGLTDLAYRVDFATADLLTAMDPPFVGALTTTLVPGTPLARSAAAGDFVLPDRWGLLTELRTLVADARFSRCRFHANHASNYLPLSLNLPADRERGLALLDRVLAARDESLLKPEYLRGL